MVVRCFWDKELRFGLKVNLVLMSRVGLELLTCDPQSHTWIDLRIPNAFDNDLQNYSRDRDSFAVRPVEYIAMYRYAIVCNYFNISSSTAVGSINMGIYWNRLGESLIV